MSGTTTPVPHNEPVLAYAPGSPERAAIKAELARLGGEVTEIPVIVDGRDVRTGKLVTVVAPHRHKHTLAETHQADARTLNTAVTAARRAQREWASWRFEDRAAVFLKAAELLAGPWRQRLNAATMLGQSKTAFQAEIDSACEVIDFLRFNVHFAERLYAEQPQSAPGTWNRPGHPAPRGGGSPATPLPLAPPGAVHLVPGPRPQGAGAGARRSGARGDPLHRLNRGLPVALEGRGRAAGELHHVSQAGGRDRRQGLHRGPSERRSGRARRGDGPRGP